jgi:hypothetical protein
VYEDHQRGITPEEVEEDKPEGDDRANEEPGDDNEVNEINIFTYSFRELTSLQTGTEQDSGLEDHHIIKAPMELSVKKDTMKDLLTVFLDIVTVQFKKSSVVVETVRGRWCLPCKLVQSISN